MVEWLRGFLRRPGLHHSAALARRFARDARGTILPVAAIGSVVLLALVGGGVDMARAYKAERRLQAACDAGALAGRRSVKTNGFDTFAQEQAAKFFKANYDHEAQNSTAVTPTFQATESGNTITGTASAEVNTTLMRVFGFSTIPITTSCTATMGVGNSDVMFVLDNTASMEWKMSDNSNASNRNCPTRDANDKYITGDMTTWSRLCNLKEAMKSFYVTVANATAGSNARVRYGFVPYANTVNVGSLLYNLNPSYLADSVTVYSRQPVTGNCSTGTVVTTANASFNEWCIRQVTYNTSTYKTFATVSNPLLTSGANGYVDEDTTATWNNCLTRDRWGNCQGGNVYTYKTKAKSSTWPGCIIERQTSAQASFTFASLATGITPYTKDLDIDLAPTGDVTTKWSPLWPEVGFQDNDHGADPAQWGCPVAAQNFKKMTKTEFLDYVDDLEDSSFGTYHDTGMLWGARLSSSTGIFAANVNSTADLVGGNVRRHLVFMTDGDPAPSSAYNMMYGIEGLDKRVSGDGDSDTAKARHQSRFKALCEAVKARGIRLWVIALGTSKTADLTACSSPNSIFEAKSSTKLNEAFQEIAKQVGELRISQ